MRAPQYQVVAVKGLIETEEQYQVGCSSLSFHFRVLGHIVALTVKWSIREIVECKKQSH